MSYMRRKLAEVVLFVLALLIHGLFLGSVIVIALFVLLIYDIAEANYHY